MRDVVARRVRVVRNLSDAAAVAEQIAPTDMTETGDPPASLCADTLHAAVLSFCRS